MLLKTKRLTVRDLTRDDWMDLRRIAEDFRQSEYAIYDMPLPVEDKKIRKLTAEFAASGLFFAVCLRKSCEMIGYICFHEENGVYDLGYCFHSAYHGRGYACESCRAAMDSISRSRKVSAFTAGTAIRNTPSCRLLEKLGFALTGVENLSFHKDENGNDITFEGGIYVKNLDA